MRKGTLDTSKMPVKVALPLGAFLIAMILVAGPASSCACATIERMTGEGLYWPVSFEESILFKCDGEIEFSKVEVRAPNLWERYWYRSQIKSAREGCRLGQSWERPAG